MRDKYCDQIVEKAKSLEDGGSTTLQGFDESDKEWHEAYSMAYVHCKRNLDVTISRDQNNIFIKSNKPAKVKPVEKTIKADWFEFKSKPETEDVVDKQEEGGDDE